MVKTFTGNSAHPCPFSKLQVSQHPQATVWTVSRMTIRHTGSSHCRRSQRWTDPPAPAHSHSPRTPASWTRRPTSPYTEPPGPLTSPHPHSPQISSTPHLQAFRQPSDPQRRRPQTSYRVPVLTVTKDNPWFNCITNMKLQIYPFH